MDYLSPIIDIQRLKYLQTHNDELDTICRTACRGKRINSLRSHYEVLNDVADDFYKFRETEDLFPIEHLEPIWEFRSSEMKVNEFVEFVRGLISGLTGSIDEAERRVNHVGGMEIDEVFGGLDTGFSEGLQ